MLILKNRLQRKEKIRALLYSRLIYMFIKVKSNKGKKGDGCAKTYWLQPFFLDATLLNR